MLRTFLKGVAREAISNVEDDIETMWLRLDEKFQPSKLTGLIMSDFKSMNVIPDENDKKIIDLVELVERGYRDLKIVKFEKEISNSTVIGIIEAVLPKFIRREWSREVNRKDSPINEDNKFVLLLDFLLEQKRILEYQDDTLRLPRTQYQNSMKDQHRNEPGNCWIHRNASHNIAECNVYLAKSNEERITCLKENGACFACLVSGHMATQCTNKQKCSISNCSRFHHQTLHEAHVAGIILHASLSDETMYKSQPCFYR